MSLMWMPAQTTVPPGASPPARPGTSAPTGAKMSAASSGAGRRLVAAAGPCDAELARERLRGGVARAREREHRAALGERDLRDQVRRRAEAVECRASRAAPASA